MTALRWILVPVTAFAVWAATLLIGIAGTSVLDSLCPADLMISGICTASWYRPATAALEVFCAALAAFGFMTLPAKVAPAFHVLVAAACFVLGGLLTIELALAGDLWLPALVAGLVGSARFWAIVSKARRRPVHTPDSIRLSREE
jgi:hypothetical protein